MCLNTPNFPEVVVVEASAGSGKTYCLAKRYLQLFMNPKIPPECISLRDILAITFTNKATIEMKERILEFLKRIAFDDFSNKEQEKDIYDSLGVDKKFARERANLIMDKLISHYNFFQVKTIDSFINALLLGCALRIDRSASFSIKRDYSKILAYCLDLVIERAANEAEVLNSFEEFLAHYLFVENRNGWFPKDDILQLMHSLFRLSNKYGGIFREYRGRSVEAIKKKGIVFKQIEELSKKIPPGMNAATTKAINRFISRGDKFDISDLPKKFSDSVVPMNKGKVCDKHFSKKWSATGKSIKELVESCATTAYNPYVKLYGMLLDSFSEVCKREDVLFLEELNRKARLLFDEDGFTVAELYYRLATRFKHYLIDEFQDTSILQWQNLRLMIEEALSCGGSLFYVGDKKQAIYRFRGGEAKLFDSVKRDFTHFNVKGAFLDKNWRSQKEIVEFNNQVFSKENLNSFLKASGINEKIGDAKEILDVFKDDKQQYCQGSGDGYVCIERVDAENQSQRNEVVQSKILILLDDLSKRFSFSDIAILTRDNNETELVTSWLLTKNLPVESEKTLNILKHSQIKEIIAFLNFLHSPIDNLNFAAFILGDIFTTASGLSSEDVRDFIFSLRKKNTEAALYALFRKQYPVIWEKYIEPFFRSVGFISVYELLTNIYQRLNVIKNFKESQAFFMKLLELAKAKEEDCLGLDELLTFLKDASADDLYVNVIGSEAIKVLTVHKSKGLEFGVVIVPFFRIDITPETGGRGTKSYIEDEEAGDLGLLRIVEDYRLYCEKLNSIYIRDYKKSCIDELNNTYVALTRSKYELYVFIPKKSANAINKAGFLIPEDIKERGEKKTYQIVKREKNYQIIDAGPYAHCDWSSLLSGEFTLDRRQRIVEGNILHLMLSVIGDCTGKSDEEIVRLACKRAQLEHSFDEKRYCEKIKQLISKDELKTIFYPQAEVFCEKEFISVFGDAKRIDRLIVWEKEAWIIDYKLTKDNQANYRNQIKEYAGILGQIYKDKKIRSFLVYLDNLEKEEVQ
ncbi:MAG: UvrD-helicase domain-containing protein [Candidatus Omnitrophica bacterium]|nr:UvrD-helicase domain-containing protein [Candidatus Omnitrophota bacterium]